MELFSLNDFCVRNNNAKISLINIFIINNTAYYNRLLASSSRLLSYFGLRTYRCACVRCWFEIDGQRHFDYNVQKLFIQVLDVTYDTIAFTSAKIIR